MTDISCTTRHRSLPVPAPAIVLALAWAAIVTVLGLRAITAGVLDAMSTDDAMRLVEVRDLLLGQNWFDLTQHRLDPPGIPMHWSRVVDAPLAALILLLRPFASPHRAETMTLVLWPSLLLAAALWLVAAIARRTSETADRDVAQIAALLLASLCPPALIHFRAGAIDHHNLQLVLLLAFILFAKEIRRSAINAILAGCAAALSLAIGLEMLPAIAIASAVILAWLIWEGAALSCAAGVYGAALAGSSLLLAALLLPIGNLGAPVCDAFGGPVLLLAAGGGLSLMAVAAVSRIRPLPARLAASTIAGAVLLGVFFKIYPGCIASPYAAVDPVLKDVWLDRVTETMSIATIARFEPQKLLGFYGLPTLTLVLATIVAIRCDAQARFRWTVAIATLAALFAISVWEVRGAAAANLVAAPLFVLGIAGLRHAGPAGWTLVGAALIFSPISIGGIGLTLWPAADQPQGIEVTRAATCRTVSGLAPLAALPPGRMLAPIDAGPAILAATGHAVFAAPYHRNNDGNLAMVNVMLAAPDAARRLLAERKIDYVLTCAGAPDLGNFVKMAPEGLAARLARGEAPVFLDQVHFGSNPDLTAWRVRK